jgi:hypothetical protein
MTGETFEWPDIGQLQNFKWAALGNDGCYSLFQASPAPRGYPCVIPPFFPKIELPLIASLVFGDHEFQP